MSWFTRLFVQPAPRPALTLAGPNLAIGAPRPGPGAAAASPHGPTAVDPLIDELVAGAETLLDAYLAKAAGAGAGAAITPAANLALALGASAAKAALDARLAALAG